MTSTSVLEAAKAWASIDPDPATRHSLEAHISKLSSSPASEQEGDSTLQHAFGERLSFGTAGLRGLMGFGPGNMNRLVVRQTTAGLARYLKRAEMGREEINVVIAYDGRIGSKEFAHDAAGVLASYGIVSCLYDTTAPTPLCGYAVRTLGTSAGIVVTASHNPPAYNGYKVYARGGTQINDPVDGLIAKEIDAVAAQGEAPESVELGDAEDRGLVRWLGEETFAKYLADAVRTVCGDESIPAEQLEKRKAFGIAYTPLHGVGAPLAKRLFQKRGFANAHVVAEQEQPDGRFPTVEFPNPEEKEATDLVIALADKYSCPLAIANDPDADRLSACARTRDGKMRQLNGDQIGAILGDQALRRAKASGKKMDECWLLSTIVSSRLLSRLASDAGAKHRETLTGFKWLGPASQALDGQGQSFLFAYEEALGYMVGPLVWDKDGLTALVALSELAFELHQEGKSLWDRLEEIHARSGLSVTGQRTIKLGQGVTGDSIMRRLRKQREESASSTKTQVGEFTIAHVDDLLEGKPKAEAKEGEIPRNDVLRYYVSRPVQGQEASSDDAKDGPRVIVRPSGTEPKVKIYLEGALDRLAPGQNYDQALQKARDELDRLAAAFMAFIQG